MDKKIYVVSRCQGQKGSNYQFHFIGYYMGKRIQKIFVSGGQFVAGEEYLIALDNVYTKENSLFGSHIKSKKVFT